LKPVFAVYSSFLQRAYDQVMHDVALQNLNVLFAIDRAGIVGEDGETHQGLYDISYLSHIPNMTIMAPCDYTELRGMMNYALNVHKGPIAVRYPRGKGPERLFEYSPVKCGRGVLVREGTQVSIISLGNMCETALETADILEKKGLSVEIINARFAKPLDSKLIIASALKTGCVFTLEDNSVYGGFGSSVLSLLNNKELKVHFKAFGYPDVPITHGCRKKLVEKYRLDSRSIANEIMKLR
jgi:1-deoxy-D-xylulose-5-phosphate synthase